jgi:tetratricopeptide (TPR) repeat protein
MSNAVEFFFDPAQLYSSPIFVGREEQLKLFENALLDGFFVDKKWILHIQAAGGMGKTKLLEQYQKIVEKELKKGKNILFNHQLFDFDFTIYQAETGLMQATAEQLSPDGFKNLLEALAAFHSDEGSLMKQGKTQIKIEKLREMFIEDYKNLEADLVVLLFDTSEKAGDAAKRFCNVLLKKMHEAKPHTIVIKAGREKFPKKTTTPLTDDEIEEIELTKLEDSQLKKYLEKGQMQVSDEIYQQLLRLWTGRPILIALFIDWINSGNDPKRLESFKDTDSFEKTLVSQTEELYFPENKAIFFMALFYRRFNTEILAELLSISLPEAETIIQHLARFSFVKYRKSIDGSEESCLLHDEMRRLMECEWISIDSANLFRIEKTKQLIEWYERKIKQETHFLKTAHFKIELLYYKLTLDINDGYNYWHDLVRKDYRGYWEIRELLNRELKANEFRGKLNNEQKSELDLRRTYVRADRGNTTAAIKLFKALLENKDTPLFIRAKVFAKLINVLTTAGDLLEALDLYNTHSERFLSFGTYNSSEKRKNDALYILGIISNNIGYFYRVIGDAERAKKSYQQAIQYFDEIKSSDIAEQDYKARAENNLGYLFHFEGKDEWAIAYCQKSLKVREKIGDKYQIGLGLNTLGIIESDSFRHPVAKGYFNAARLCFTEAKNNRGLALVDIAEGKMCRQIGWYKKDNPDIHDEDSAVSNFQKAQKLLDRAIETLKAAELHNVDLVEALHERGLLYREQEQYENSRKDFEESLSLAQKFADDLRIKTNYFVLYNKLSLSWIDFYLKSYEQSSVWAKAVIADSEKYPHILTRAYKVLAEIYFKNNNYVDAFQHVAKSLLTRIQVDPNSQDDSPAKRDFLYQSWLQWIGVLLNKIENDELKKKYGEFLIAEIKDKGKGEKEDGFIDKDAFYFRIRTICDL